MTSSEPLRILHVLPSLQKGGAERLCLDTVRWLRKLPGLEVLLVTFSDRNHYREEYPDVEPIVLDSCVIPSILGPWKVSVNAWESLVNGFRPHVIHSHLFQAEVVTRYRLAQGVRYFTHCHDNMPQIKRLDWDELFSKQRLTEAYERSYILKQYSACDNRFIAISQDTECYFRQNLPEKLHGNITLLPNAIDWSRFSAHSASPPVPGSPLRLINIGSFVPKKNQTFLLDILQKLRSQGHDAHLTLVGDGPLRMDVMNRARDMKLEPYVDFTGNVSRVEELLWKSHIYVHSATYEPFGLVLLEAMAAGLPVIALDGKGNRQIMEDGRNGFIISLQDSASFVDKITEIVADITLRTQIVSHCKTTSFKYHMPNYVQNLLNTYTVEPYISCK